ncbi:hypothetical protein D1007_22459 [Hordeum vulgare]|nr:hypothetical protein D1007_22459 [Hordeum vulgare]
MPLVVYLFAAPVLGCVKVEVRAIPVAKAAELLVYLNLDIVEDDADVTERAVLQVSTMFKEQLRMDVLAAVRALFKVDDVNATAVEDALISHAAPMAWTMRCFVEMQ